MTDTTAAEIFTATSALSLVAIFSALPLVYIGLMRLLPKTASKADRLTFVWLVSDLNFDGPTSTHCYRTVDEMFLRRLMQ